ncbi:MAG: hypothetical protein DI537_23900 [Stutzerimonas stutzeri]|nr:MAG: hypothetical protein DI537_23900 [Stutzerimonas stutzeri]
MSMGWSDRRVPAPSLDALDAVEVMCFPCGRGSAIEGDELAKLSERGIARIDDLRPRLFCRGCGERHQLSLMPVFRRPMARPSQFRAA